MTARAQARQYANALFDVAQRTGRADQVRREIVEVAALFAAHPDLTRALGSPLVPVPRKTAVVQALVDQSTGLSAEVARLLLLLADRDRLLLVDQIAAAVLERSMGAAQAARADITTTVALDETVSASLARALGQAVGRPVTVTARVDPGIIGGVVARVGSMVYDGSVPRQLERIRTRLLARA
jgi:F-type H+-transporting ATPase subunit delta